MTVGKCIGSSSGLKICFQYYPSKVLANNWPAMVPTKWVAQHYCSKWHVSQGRGLLQIKICPHHFCDEMTNNFLIFPPLRRRGSYARKKIGNMTTKTKAPTCGQLCRDDGKPAPTTGIPTPPFHLASCRHLRYMRMFRAPITTITNPPDKAD